MQEKENLLDILLKTKQAVKDEDVVLMRELSDRTVHSASIYGDEDNIAIAVIVYSLSKIVERKKYHEYPDWPKFFQTCMNGLSIAIIALKKGDSRKFRSAIKEIRSRVGRISGNLRHYIQDVFRKAEITKASRVYEHGISMQKTSELLGISVFELAEYAGSTGISDVDLSITKNVKERLKTAEEVLG
ncbi:MAG: hypothetical protein V1886_00765 [archaeon]